MHVFPNPVTYDSYNNLTLWQVLDILMYNAINTVRVL